MSRSIFSIFLLLMVLVGGCQPRPKLPQDSPGPVAYDDLYQSRHDDTYSSALYHFSMARLVGIDGELESAARSLESAVAADPDSAYLRVSLAEIYLHLGEDEKAFRAAEDALLRDPELLQAHLLMSNLMSASDDLPGAIKHLEIVAELAPDREGIKMQLALFYERANDMDKSILTLKSILADSPESTYALLTLARAYSKTGLASLAEEAYKKLLEINPESFLALTELGKLYAGSGREKGQETLLLDYLQEFADDSRVRHHLVGIYVELERLDAALLQLEILVKQDPGDTTALRKAGLLNVEARDWVGAGEYFRELIELDPTDAQAKYYLGIVLEESGQWGDALNTFSEVGEESAVYEDSLIHQGYNLHKLGRTADAVALLEAHRDRLSSRPEIFDYLSYLYSDLDRNSEAMDVIAEGLQAYPEDNTLLFRKIVLLDQSGKKDEADDSARLLLQVNPEHVNALNYLAYSYAVRNENLGQALAMAEKALAARDEYYIRDTLGWVLYRLGRFEDALTELQVAVSAKPDDPVVLEHLGDVFQALGRNEEALSAFQKAVPVSEDNSDKLLEKIDALKGGVN